MTVCGMDPGMSGAIAILDSEGGLINIFDMPVFAVERKIAGGKTKTKRHVNVHDLGAILRPYADGLAVIEQVSAMPNDGAVQAFQFGFGAGALHGAAGALRMQIVTITPQAWKKHFGLKADKEEARQLATRRWPAQSSLFKRKLDAGRAEAALIALCHIETVARRAA